MTIAQKLPLARTLNRAVRTQINDAFQRSGQALPCSVVTVQSSGIVTVKFEVNSTFTLPPVTIPVYGFEYIRYPIQVGDKGFTVPADASLAGTSGLGTGVSDLSEPANLGALVFLPCGSAKWFATPDPNAVVLYGPNGVQLRDTSNASNVTLTPSGIAINTPKIDITTSANITVHCGGDCDLNISGNANITASEAVVNAPTTINDDLIVNGSVTATGEVTGNGIPLSTHLHTGVQTGGGTSGPPIL